MLSCLRAFYQLAEVGFLRTHFESYKKRRKKKKMCQVSHRYACAFVSLCADTRLCLVASNGNTGDSAHKLRSNGGEEVACFSFFAQNFFCTVFLEVDLLVRSRYSSSFFLFSLSISYWCLLGLVSVYLSVEIA